MRIIKSVILDLLGQTVRGIKMKHQCKCGFCGEKVKEGRQITFISLIISCCIHSVIIPIFMLPEAMGETSKTFSYKI